MTFRVNDGADRVTPSFGLLRCGAAAASTFLVLYAFLALLLLNVVRSWITGAASIDEAAGRLRLVEVPVLLIDFVTGAVGCLVGLTVAHRHGLGRGALAMAIGAPVLVAVLLLTFGGRNGTAAALDLVAVMAGTAGGAALSRQLSGPLE